MASLSQILSHAYNMTILFFSILLLELAIFIGGATKRSIPTDQFLKIIDQKAPIQRYRATGLGFEPSECRVCLSVYEEGDEVRKLKCKHIFHKDCLDTWLQHDSGTCPLCRRPVLPEKVVLRHRNHRYYDGSDDELMILYTFYGNFLSWFL